MYKLKKTSGRPSTDYHEYYCDELIDRDAIDLNKEDMGCYAHIINTNEDYMLNSKKEWIKVNLGGVLEYLK